jgi:hypothetical protein
VAAARALVAVSSLDFPPARSSRSPHICVLTHMFARTLALALAHALALACTLTLHRHHNSKRAPSLFTEGEMLLNLGITTNIYRFTTFWSSQAPNLFQAVAISEARG